VISSEYVPVAAARSLDTMRTTRQALDPRPECAFPMPGTVSGKWKVRTKFPLSRYGIQSMMNYYAQPRMTRDLDVVVELTAADAGHVTALFAGDFYCDPDTIRDAIVHQGMFNLIHTERVVKVDCIVRKDTLYRRTEFARRRSVPLDDVMIWVVSAEDLLLSKLYWAKDTHSELQLSDARNIIASVTELDWCYLEHWAEHLGVASMLAEVRA